MRVIIYELATDVGKPIEPEPVVDRSNKFVWGRYWNRRVFHHPSSSMSILESKEERLAVTQLSRTCRQIYSELERWPVFYRVNRFRFYSMDRMRRFLAALTPARREMIRHVDFISKTRFDEYNSITVAEYVDPPRRDHRKEASSNKKLVLSDVLTLLSQCTDLREFNVTLWIYGYQLAESIEQCREVARLHEKLAGAESQEGEEKAPWSYFSLRNFTLTLATEYGEVRLSDGRLVKPKEVPWVPRETLTHINEAKQTLASHRRRMASERSRFAAREEIQLRGLKNVVSEIELQQAALNAGIDFPGEVRVSQDRSEISGPIARRTRGQLNGTSIVSDWGTVESGRSEKYDKEGLLVWDIREICGVRWHEGNIQCKVAWTYPSAGNVTSWEELYAIMERQGCYLLEDFYRKRWVHRHETSIEQQLAAFRTLPRPRAIIDALQAGGGPIDDDYAHTQEWKQTVRRWLYWDARWKNAVKRYTLKLDKERRRARASPMNHDDVKTERMNVEPMQC